MRFNIISAGLRIVTLQAMVQDLLVAGEVGLQLSDVEIGNPGGLSSGMGRAAKAAWGWLPNVCWISSCCLPCPQLWFQNSCQLPHQHNPLPGKWYRLGTMYDLPEQYARLESHGFIPLCFWRKKEKTFVSGNFPVHPFLKTQKSCRKVAAILYPGMKRSG